ncbi:flbA [Symbiodinium microadriaticum]|nr:flbA [Symbiodinium microadriaticum]
MGKHAEAVEIFQVVLEFEPDNPDAHNNIALAYGCLELHKRGVEHLERANELKPDNYLFMNNLALQYRCLGRYEEGIDTLKKACKLHCEPEMLCNLGGIFAELKDYEGAMKFYNAAKEIDPDNSTANVDLACTNFLMGNMQEGFDLYEWRFRHYNQLQYYLKAYDQDKLWNGEDSLEGKRLLIYAEQGMGDCIQFARWFPELKERGAHIILHCSQVLKPVMERLESVDEILIRDIVNGKGDEFPEYDYQCCTMSLPHLLKSYEFSGEPYIEPTTEKFKDFVQKEHPNTINVGVSWAGNPAHPNDKLRSIPLKEFWPLHNTDGVKLFNLQVDMRKRSYRSLNGVIDLTEECDDMNLIDMTNMIQTLEDTCTILAGLDLVITCDTALAHIAGAMGIPCWVILQYNPDWRWQREGETTEWYDSVRLFRQPKRGDWTSVFAEAQKELEQHAKLPGSDKEVCLKNFCYAFQREIFSEGVEPPVRILADNCERKTIKMLLGTGLPVTATNFGNAGSLRKAFELALEEGEEEDIAYFVEDDYLHLPNAPQILREGIHVADYITLYDHPDKYTRAYGGGETSKDKSIWDNWTKGDHPHDHKAFTELGEKRTLADGADWLLWTP